MALALTTGTAQTTAGAALTPLYLPVASYPVSNNAPGETQYKNLSVAVDQPNFAKLAVASVADIFKGVSSCSPADGQARGGLSMLFGVYETWKVEDAANTSLAPIFAPASCHTVIRVPLHALVTSTTLRDLVHRNIGLLLRDNDDLIATGLNALLHGTTEF